MTSVSIINVVNYPVFRFGAVHLDSEPDDACPSFSPSHSLSEIIEYQKKPDLNTPEHCKLHFFKPYIETEAIHRIKFEN